MLNTVQGPSPNSARTARNGRRKPLGILQRLAIWFTLFVLMLMCLYPPYVQATFRVVGANIPANPWKVVSSNRINRFVLDFNMGRTEDREEDPGPNASEIGPADPADPGDRFLQVPEARDGKQPSAGTLWITKGWNDLVAKKRRTVHYRLVTYLDWPKLLAQFFVALVSGFGLLFALGRSLESQDSIPGQDLSCGRPSSGVLDPAKVLTAPHQQAKPRPEPLYKESLRQNLWLKCMGDHAKVDRLIEYEHERNPGAKVETLMESAIERWERDNR
jgi:hypothetical protein